MRVNVEVSARKFGVPFECPCCGAAPDTEVLVAAKPSHHVLAFPYCKRCVEHVRIWDSSGIASAGAMVAGIVSAIFIAATVRVVFGLAVFVVAAVVAWWARSARRAAAKFACGASCASTSTALGYVGWSGSTSSFWFESPTFAARFAEQNTAILANVSPQLRKLIEGYHKARLAVPTPAVAAGVAPPPMTGPDWIKRIEKTEGTVARRVALGRALEMIEDPQPRRELIQTVARLELAPLLDKLAATSSPGAKKSLLQDAISTIRADNISDELEAAEVQSLEARIAELK